MKKVSKDTPRLPTCEYCGKPGVPEPHECPNKVDLEGDTTSRCHCCPKCERACGEEV